MQDLEVSRKIAAMGRSVGPDALGQVHRLFWDEQIAHAAVPATALDVAYGPDPRHKLDLYAPEADGSPAPILVWVHGGGHVRGDKRSPDSPYEANVARFAARAGFLGVCINYRLAPEHRWPAGGEDVARAIAWIKERAGEYGGDPNRILLVGTSAGATNCATFLKLHPDTRDVMGVVLLSGMYGYAPLKDETRDLLYFSRDPEEQAAQASGPALEVTTVPLLVTCAEFDPPQFHHEFVEFLRARLARTGMLPRSLIVSGHNHYSQPYHIGTSDTRLADEILAFARSIEPR